jgi:KaiC/GvpD/RAD55 family RecA-like ATPase
MRVETGIFGLDELLGGGYRTNTVNIVLGSTGTGKTIFALQFLLKGLEKEEKCVFISFDADESRVIDVAISLGWDEVEDYVKKEQLVINKFYAESASFLNNEMLNYITKEAKEHARIAIDSFTPLISAVGYETRNDINWFFSKLREVGVALITLEEPLNGELSEPSITIPIFLGDSVVHLKNIGYGEAFNRTLRVLKHLGSWHAEGVFPYRILAGIGIFVEGTEYVLESFEKIDLNKLLMQHGVNKKEIEDMLFSRMQKLAKSKVAGAGEAISEILKRLKG